jgi:hypothetical protein
MHKEIGHMYLQNFSENIFKTCVKEHLLMDFCNYNRQSC